MRVIPFLWLWVVNMPADLAGDVTKAVKLLMQMLPGQVQTHNIPDPFIRRFGKDEGYIPAAMVNVSSANDVKTALEICTAYKVPTALRSSIGHSFIGQSTVNNGIIINLNNLREVTINEVGNGRFTVKFGGGIEILEAYSQLARHDPPLGIPAGTCPSVGIAGLASGGGLGFSSPMYGTTADRLVAVEAIIYNNKSSRFELVEATGYNEHSELFFAVRGGMGGNYGALVSLTFAPFRANKVVVMNTGHFKPHSGSSADVMKKFFDYMHSKAGGPHLSGDTRFSNGAVRLRVQCFCEPKDDCRHCHKTIDDLQQEVGIGEPWRAEQDFGEAMWLWAGCNESYPTAGLAKCTDKELHEAMEKCWRSTDKYDGQTYQSKSLIFQKQIPLMSLREMEERTKDTVCQPGPCNVHFIFHGHAVLSQPHDCNEAKGNCTSFDHRSPGWVAHIIINWPEGETDVERKLQWLNRLYENVYEYSMKTAYQNLIDIDLADGRRWVKEYFPNPTTYQRLQQAKCHYNAIDMFNYPSVASMMVEINDEICK